MLNLNTIVIIHQLYQRMNKLEMAKDIASSYIIEKYGHNYAINLNQIEVFPDAIIIGFNTKEYLFKGNKNKKAYYGPLIFDPIEEKLYQYGTGRNQLEEFLELKQDLRTIRSVFKKFNNKNEYSLTIKEIYDAPLTFQYLWLLQPFSLSKYEDTNTFCIKNYTKKELKDFMKKPIKDLDNLYTNNLMRFILFNKELNFCRFLIHEKPTSQRIDWNKVIL